MTGIKPDKPTAETRELILASLVPAATLIAAEAEENEDQPSGARFRIDDVLNLAIRMAAELEKTLNDGNAFESRRTINKIEDESDAELNKIRAMRFRAELKQLQDDAARTATQ